VFVENMVASVEAFFTDAGSGHGCLRDELHRAPKTEVEEITPVPHLWW
jgi:hypothetical protein